MPSSAEVRWFLPGPLTDEVATWFTRGAVDNLSIEDRSDRYPVFPGSESVGINLRDVDDAKGGKFEVTGAVGAPEVVAISAEAQGRADTWVKWTFPTEDFVPWVTSITTGPTAEQTWVAVGKRRQLGKFSRDTGAIVEVASSERPVAGCNVELVALEAGGAEWWTFGFESFGDRRDVRSHLRAVVDHWFANIGGPARLHVAQSVSYPTWSGGIVGAR